MNEKESGMDPKGKALVLLLVLLIVGAVIGIAISIISLNVARGRIGLNEAQRAVWRVFADNYMLGTIIISINLTLLLGLLWSYFQSYRRTKSNFLLGLVLFIGVLVLQTLLNLPLISIILGNSTYQSGIFTILPNMFETIALIILFYLSME
jgi:hypothetical protein